MLCVLGKQSSQDCHILTTKLSRKWMATFIGIDNG